MSIFSAKRTIDEEFVKLGSFTNKKLRRKESSLRRKIRKKHFDYEKNKQEFSKNVQKLHRRTLRTRPDVSSLLSYDKFSIIQTRQAEKALRKEFKTMVEIIFLLHELIKNEDLDLIFDLKGPLELCGHFINGPYRNVMMALTTRYAGDNKELRKKLGEDALDELIRLFDDLIERFHELITVEYDLIRSAALNTNKAEGTDIVSILSERTRAKRVVTARMNHIKRMLEEQESHLQKTVMIATRHEDREALEACLPYVQRIIGYFHKLEKAMLERMEFSHKLITQSIAIAQEQRRGIAAIKQSIDALHRDFDAINGTMHDQLAKLGKESALFELKKQQLKEFAGYKQEVDGIYKMLCDRIQDLNAKEYDFLKREGRMAKREEEAADALVEEAKRIFKDARRIVKDVEEHEPAEELVPA